jgi:hypothetical protein
MDTDNIITETPDLSYDSSETNTGGLSWSTIIRYFIIILILIFLGFNIFTYLGKITEWILDLIRPVLAFFGYGLAETTKQVVKVSATGTKGLVDVAAGTVTGGIDILEKGLSHKKKRGKSDMKALDNSVSNQQSSEPMPDDAGSKTQASKARGKAGYCYIGEDRGFRSCIQVGEADMCMSGDIFPTQDICINPSLRE